MSLIAKMKGAWSALDANEAARRRSAAMARSPREAELLGELGHLAGGERADEPVRVAVSFTGTVQGVGFRWTNKRLAEERSLAGWVRNRADGSVDMEIQGAPALISIHLARLHATYAGAGYRIWVESYAWREPAVETGFAVRG